jgi:methylmalonyl-CoA/ethylmalonyl-CoA epimerase
MVNGIKHIAVAVADIDAAATAYESLLGLEAPRRYEWEAGRSREAHFDFGDVEVQLCQSTDSDGRFAQHIAQFGEGVQHVCLAVDDIETAIERAVAAGATLKPCKACDKIGPHPHSEGWVAFLKGQAVPGLEIEFMQVYTEGNRPAEYATGV